MDRLSNDIINDIDKKYDINDRNYIMEKLLLINENEINVGADQLIRSILIVSNGNVELFKKIFESNFYGDPRDLIVEAMERTNNKTNYGMKPLMNCIDTKELTK